MTAWDRRRRRVDAGKDRDGTTAREINSIDETDQLISKARKRVLVPATNRRKLMNATETGFWRSPVVLTAFIGFIMLFSTLMAGFAFVDAGHEKWGDPAWTGDSSGVAIEGFLKGADYKSIESPTNPYPEVKPVVRGINQGLFSQHTRLFSWLTVAGELLLPIGIMALMVISFRRSRGLLVVLTMLAASLNFLYVTEGDSSSNPPMIFMWLAIIWIAMLWPAAARFYAVDLSAPVDHPREQETTSIESGAGLWVFFGVILLIVVAGSLEMYWDQLGTFAALTAATFAITAALTLLKRRIVQEPRRESIRPMTVDPGHI
jgi:thiosulfate dehydrogenase [quinone] large subunit